MTYIPNPTPGPGTVTTTQLGGDITTQAKVLLQQATEKEQRQAMELAESSTMSTGGLTL